MTWTIDPLLTRPVTTIFSPAIADPLARLALDAGVGVAVGQIGVSVGGSVQVAVNVGMTVGVSVGGGVHVDVGDWTSVAVDVGVLVTTGVS